MNTQPFQIAQDTASDKQAFEKKLGNADGIAAVAQVIRSRYPESTISDEHMEFLANLGGEDKLREVYYEVLKFDDDCNDKHHLPDSRNKLIKTSQFILEEEYQEKAISSPELFADPTCADQGVKHRASLTRSITDGFNHAVRYLRDKGYQPQEISFFDLGTGTGKPLLISQMPEFGFNFKKAVGVDYYQPLLDRAKINMELAGLQVGSNSDSPVQLVFSNAATFKNFNGLNLIYMYNPFQEPVMVEVEKNLRRYAGKSVVIYNKPLHSKIFEQNGWKKIDAIGDINTPSDDKTTLLFSHGF